MTGNTTCCIWAVWVCSSAFTPLFESQWVEPYLRVGVNYLHKNFASAYGGNFVDDPRERRTGNRPMCGIPAGAHRIRTLLFRFRSVQV